MEQKILDRKDIDTQRVLLENFLDERMYYKLQTDETITSETPVRGENGLIEKLGSYYVNNYPMIVRQHAFITCQQSRAETFMTWWDRKMRKAQECAITTMTPDNWLELELLRRINNQNLRKRLLQETDPALTNMVSIATAWQSAEEVAHDHGSLVCFSLYRS